jgi:V/A-type H+/Na+-transporting ATPase subunit D
MAFKYQFNKTESQSLQKQLKIRRSALPILKSKESALRAEVKKIRTEIENLDSKLKTTLQGYEEFMGLFAGFPDLVKVANVKISPRKIAGVYVPVFEDITFDISEYSLFASPSYYPIGIKMIQNISTIRIMMDVAKTRMTILERDRRKTTQKVNLFEKVQIPNLEDAIRRIKRFLEDAENLEKSSQKVVKSRLSAMEMADVAMAGA